jgi:hypothetical protein
MAPRKRKGAISRKGGQSAKRISIDARRSSAGNLSHPAVRRESIATINSAAGLILAVTENRNWIEVFFEGDMMHTKTVNLPAGRMFDIYIEEIPHKTTVYEHPRTMILFDGPCDLDIIREGDKVVVSGQSLHADKN